MQTVLGLSIPTTLEEVCTPSRLALIVYDMQAGIVKQIKNGQEITNRVRRVLDAARALEFERFLLATCRCRRNSWVFLSSAPRWHGSG